MREPKAIGPASHVRAPLVAAERAEASVLGDARTRELDAPRSRRRRRCDPGRVEEARASPLR